MWLLDSTTNSDPDNSESASGTEKESDEDQDEDDEVWKQFTVFTWISVSLNINNFKKQ